MNRRKWLKQVSQGALFLGVPVLLGACRDKSNSVPSTMPEQQSHWLESPAAGTVFYTEKNPGRWAKKVTTHLPQMTLGEVDSQSRVLTVLTPHEMLAHSHYIVKHTVLNDALEVVDEYVFNPESEPVAQSTLSIDANYTGRLYAISLCNLHDAWLNYIDVS